MNGQKQIVDLRIEPEVFASKDQEMLQDLVRAAVNEAVAPRRWTKLTNQMKKNARERHPRNAPGCENPRFVLKQRRNANSRSLISLPFAFSPLSPVHTSYFTNWPLWTSYST